MTNKQPFVYTVREVTEILGISSVTARRHIKSGIIKSIKVGPKLVRIPATEVQRLLEVKGESR